MKDLLLLCKKKLVHFSFNEKICRQTNGVAKGSSSGPVIAWIFMEEPGRSISILPTLSNYMLPWKRYVDDTLAWIKPAAIEYAKEIVKWFFTKT